MQSNPSGSYDFWPWARTSVQYPTLSGGDQGKERSNQVSRIVASKNWQSKPRISWHSGAGGGLSWFQVRSVPSHHCCRRSSFWRKLLSHRREGTRLSFFTIFTQPISFQDGADMFTNNCKDLQRLANMFITNHYCSLYSLYSRFALEMGSFCSNGRSISKDPGWPRLRGPWRRLCKAVTDSCCDVYLKSVCGTCAEWKYDINIRNYQNTNESNEFFCWLAGIVFILAGIDQNSIAFHIAFIAPSFTAANIRFSSSRYGGPGMIRCCPDPATKEYSRA